MQSRSRICRVSESWSEIPAIFSKTSGRGGTRIRRRITHSKLEFEDCRRSGPSSWPVGVKRTKNWSAYSANTFERRSSSEPNACRKREKRSEEHTSELQSQSNLVCRLLLEKKKST